MATDVALPESAARWLVDCLASGLHRWQPTRPITEERAMLFLAKPAQQRIDADWSGQNREELRGQTKAVFDDFIENGRATYGVFTETGGRTGLAQMKILAPNPGVRLFGGFVDPNCFVGLRLMHRDELPFKPTKQKGAIDYKTLARELVDDWTILLPRTALIRIRNL